MFYIIKVFLCKFDGFGVRNIGKGYYYVVWLVEGVFVGLDNVFVDNV